MTLFRTDLLINNYLNAEQLNLITQRKELIEPISSYFPDSTCLDIHTNLLRHGLFNPENSTRHIVEKWIKPHLDISINHPLYHHLIYGIDPVPKYLGYFVGAHLVDHWFAKQQIKVNELIYIPTEDFFKQS